MSTVSIIIPARNRHDLVRATVASALAQDHAGTEVILVDNGSTPALHKQDFAEFAALPAFAGFQVLACPSGNANAARNFGYDHSNGEFVLFLDSDDLLAESCVRLRLEEFGKHEGIDAIIGRCEYFGETPGDMAGKYWGKWDDRFTDMESFLGVTSDNWQTAGPLWRRSFMEASSLRWDESINKGQDWEFHVRALSKGLRYVKVPLLDHFWRCDPTGTQMSSPKSQLLSLSRGQLLRTLECMFTHAIRSGYVSTDALRKRLRQRGMQALFLRTVRDSRSAGLPWNECLHHFRTNHGLGVINFAKTLEALAYLGAWKAPGLGQRIAKSLFHRRFNHLLHVTLED
ncbi:glycosyltransferase family 2 protein [Luteolibacter luteus]|uniref:Glycosyltransferase n=1 Tax=Luteolibacter luteus TaxID=2728835 RepID=A0A858RCF4_9BACT|nr:glycosyltransferase family 2 protein [Luteolibacter luteus]QJE94278.1 glycosyltransferase [Luteolibacter luteus]